MDQGGDCETLALFTVLSASLFIGERSHMTDATTKCPKCSKPLSVWYDLASAEARCACENKECIVWKCRIRGEGNSTTEAFEKFLVKANKVKSTKGPTK
jgi:hypothetical protein